MKVLYKTLIKVLGGISCIYLFAVVINKALESYGIQSFVIDENLLYVSILLVVLSLHAQISFFGEAIRVIVETMSSLADVMGSFKELMVRKDEIATMEEKVKELNPKNKVGCTLDDGTVLDFDLGEAESILKGNPCTDTSFGSVSLRFTDGDGGLSVSRIIFTVGDKDIMFTGSVESFMRNLALNAMTLK